MKRFFCGLMALAMAIMCVGCGSTPAQQEPEYQPSGMYYDLTGIDPREVLVTVDGNETNAELYLYWTCYTASNLEYQMNMLSTYYGMYTEMLNADGTLNWEANFTDAVTMSQFAKKQADSAVISYATLENLAKENGVELTEEDRAAMAAQHTANVEQLGGEEAFAQYLADLGISSETFERISSYDYLLAGLTKLAVDENSDLYMDTADYDQYATYADHILVSTTDLTTNEPLSEDQIAEKTALAEDILAQLQAVEGEELLKLFDQLADEYSEDTGRATNPDGYIYTPGTMVTEFEDAASALSPGQISGLVESTYGYHIILRKDLAEGLAQQPEQREALAEEHLHAMLEMKAQNAQVVYSEKLDDFDAGAFYQNYITASKELQAAREAEAGTETAGSESSENADAEEQK